MPSERLVLELVAAFWVLGGSRTRRFREGFGAALSTEAFKSLWRREPNGRVGGVFAWL